MTLVIAGMNQEQVVMVAERRLWAAGQYGDFESKLMYLGTRDARIAVAITGVARRRASKTSAAFQTSAWLLDTLRAIGESDPTIGVKQLLTLFHERSSETFGAFPRTASYRVSFLFVGYVDDAGAAEPARGYVTTISNCMNESGETVLPRAGEMTLYWEREARTDGATPFSAVVTHGREDLVPDDQLAALLRLVTSGATPATQIDRIVAMIRDAADSPRSCNQVGTDCMCLVVPRDPKAPADNYYYPLEDSSLHCSPARLMILNDGIICEPHLVYERRAADGTPLIMNSGRRRMSDPCGCGSGRKYGNCCRYVVTEVDPSRVVTAPAGETTSSERPK